MAYQLPEKLRTLEPYQPIIGQFNVRLDANESFISLPDNIRKEIGEKVARQIILDLKGKVNGAQMSLLESKNNNELVDALLALGYKQADVKKVVNNVKDDLTIEEQIKEALKLLLK